MSGAKRNQISKVDKVAWDSMGYQMADQVTVSDTLFLIYQEAATDDFTVVPVHASIQFLAAFRRGIGSVSGYNQEFFGKV